MSAHTAIALTSLAYDASANREVTSTMIRIPPPHQATIGQQPRRVSGPWLATALSTVTLAVLVTSGARAACDQSICPGDPCTITGNHTIDDACVLDWATKAVTIASGATITAQHGDGFTILAGSLDHNGKLEVVGGSITLAVTHAATVDGSVRTAGIVDPDWTSGGDVAISAGSLAITQDIDTHGELHVESDDGEQYRTGGDGGSVTLTSSSSLELSTVAAIRTTGQEGDGGGVSIEAGGNVVIAGSITSDADCAPLSDPGSDPSCDTAGTAGDVAITGHTIGLTGSISATSKQATGGTVALAAESTASLAGSIVVNGEHSFGVGGSIAVAAAGDIFIGGKIRANGTRTNALFDFPAEAGDVAIVSNGNHSIHIADAARIEATGDALDGSIDIGPACDVVVDGTVDARRAADSTGEVTVGYRNTFSGSGRMHAGESPFGGNYIDCRSNGSDGCATPPAGVSCGGFVCDSGALELLPPATLTPVALTPCTVACGNSFIDPGEACDDGNTMPCDGCSPTCTPQGDGSACGTTACHTGGICSTGTCRGSTPVDCDDGNACTVDGPCHVTNGCGRTPVNCDDTDPETTDWCDAVLGCQHRTVAPLKAAELVAIVTDIMDSCPSASPMACLLGAHSCTQLIPASRHQIRFKRLLSPPGDQRLALRGEATFATPVAMDPVAKGLGLLVSNDATRLPILRITLPAGSSSSVGRGWVAKSSSTVTQWAYADKSSAPIGGVIKVKIRLSIATGLVKVAISGRGDYAAASTTSPLTAIVTFDPTADSTTLCSQLSFDGSTGCRLKGASLTCK